MAAITDLLNKIKSTVYGSEMRTYIHDAIKTVNDDVNTKEPKITSGTASQYYRGDKSLSNFAADVRNTVLTGLSTAANTAISAADTVLSALGKLQKQITAHIGSHANGTTSAHVKLSDGVSNTLGVSGSYAATPKAVYAEQEARKAADEALEDDIYGEEIVYTCNLTKQNVSVQDQTFTLSSIAIYNFLRNGEGFGPILAQKLTVSKDGSVQTILIKVTLPGGGVTLELSKSTEFVNYIRDGIWVRTLCSIVYKTVYAEGSNVGLNKFVITWNSDNTITDKGLHEQVTKLKAAVQYETESREHIDDELTELKNNLETKLDKTTYASTTQAGVIKLHKRGDGTNISGLVVYEDGTAVVNTNANKGTTRDGAGQISIAAASEAEIAAKTHEYKPIVPKTLDYAVEQSAAIKKLQAAIEALQIKATQWSQIESLTIVTRKMQSDDPEYIGYEFVSGTAKTTWGAAVEIIPVDGHENWSALVYSALCCYCTIEDGKIKAVLDHSEYAADKDVKVTLGGTWTLQ